MTTDNTNNESVNAVNEEEQAVNQALAEAENKVRADFRRKQLLEEAEMVLKVDWYTAPEGESEEEKVQRLTAKVRDLRVRLVAEGDSELICNFDKDVLGLVYGLIRTNWIERTGGLVEMVNSNLPQSGRDGQAQLGLRIRIALIEYALAHTILDEAALRMAAADNKNPGTENWSVQQKVEGIVHGDVSPEDAIAAADLEVNRQVWSYICGKGNNPFYLKTACENLCTALLAVGRPAAPHLMALYVNLKNMRVGG